MTNQFDIIIVGGGVLGSSIAYQLLKDGYTGKIAVFEKDSTYRYASTTLSGGGFRTTFTTEVNMQIGKYCNEIFLNFKKDMSLDGEPAHIDLKQCGYMFLLAKEKLSVFKDVVEYQKALGINSHLLTPEEIKGVIPELNINGIAGAVYSPEDGILDPYSVMQWYIKYAKRLGAKYINQEVAAITTDGLKKVTGVASVTGEKYFAPIVINAAGAWAGDLSRKMGIDIPVRPLSRQLFHIDIQIPFQKLLPFTFDLTGTLFRHEGSKIMTGSMTNLDFGYNFNWDRSYFENEVWPVLAERCELFERVKLEKGWAGLYEYNDIDHNGIVGVHPAMAGYYLATGFSGHGLMQAPAVGKGISELIRLGKFKTIDLTALQYERFANKKFIIETTVV